MSFENNLRLIKRMASSMPSGQSLIVFYEPDTEASATDLAAFGVSTYQFQDGLSFVFKSLPIIMGARLIFCDNYYAFLGGLIHSAKMRVIQLWHANGAIKKFGWEDSQTKQRSKSDQKRFQLVYNQFDEYVVASKTMGTVFKNSYHVPFDRMQLLGYPRSDRFFKDDWLAHARDRVYAVAPELRDKRVILYAPTYRDGIEFNPPADLAEAITADAQAEVVVKLHPLLKNQEAVIADQNIQSGNSKIHFYNQLSTADLLSVTDTLITDYSSVAFDFTLLPNAHSMLFFMFDLKEYQQKPGIQSDLLNWLPSQPILKTADLAVAIKKNQRTDFTKFNQHWNTYNDGFATKRVIDRYI
ncbi:CDP-glycerol glycerophosphotransferase family protein [Nicoliella spurrieriana]|uniref:CDP-glycerol glycerophosphotransferase family protein n=1 Tax=Nicoliella spurrieriana TaxID=2925830 RepID=A0A976RRQ2_9LACO|nr:CDP-glycerol glycerophosphotransferase family protein [Nicoliella spurrieriana]UQS86531.1 CDP-glycerol glycerophosphotransferase family protein [Nicoliella spurrieriana]